MYACDHSHYTLYNYTYFMGLIAADSAKIAKLGSLKNFPLYSIIIIGKNITGRKRRSYSTGLTYIHVGDWYYVPDVHVHNIIIICLYIKH